jgi:hypothetical protein
MGMGTWSLPKVTLGRFQQNMLGTVARMLPTLLETVHQKRDISKKKKKGGTTMAQDQQETANGSEAIIKSPRSLAIGEKGVDTAKDFASLMSAVMSDVLDGRLSPQIANAVVNAGGKLLKVVEMQHKYASTPNVAEATEPPNMSLTGR